MLSYSLNCTNEADFAIMNGGGCRADLPVGDITRYDLYTSFPFKNIVVDVKLTGSEVWHLINGFTTGINHWSGEPIGTTPQLSRNIKVMYETVRKGNDEFRELRSVEIGGEPLDFEANYTIATTDFIGGTSQGDNYLPPRKNPQDRELPKNITEVLEDYIRGLSPVKINLERRMADIHGSPKPSHARQHGVSIFLSLLMTGFAMLVMLCQ